ncbi:MAG: M14 family zinc carboxypeptidase [Planctomycetota bacterium]
MIRLLSIIAMAASLVPTASAWAQRYRTYTEMGGLLNSTAQAYPSLCQMHDLGPSFQGRSMWALRITDAVDSEENEPEVKLIAGMHGDEIMGPELCLRLVEYLTVNYGVDARVTNIVDELDIWIVPLMNPDGYDRTPRTRNNAQGINLNRDFPDPYTSPSNTTAGRAAETAAIMNWSFDHSFDLAANYHGGALVVNYPFDANATGASVYTPSPDDDMFIYISEAYSIHNGPMWNSPYFFHGITNGADWYAIHGGMQDWSYVYMGTNEVTIEVSENKQPPATQIPQFWEENRESMLSYLETALIGVRGVVTDAQSGIPVFATVSVVDRNHDVFTDPDVGDYHRMLLPGLYELQFEAEGLDTVRAPNLAVAAAEATRLDVALDVPPVILAPDGGETLDVGTESVVSWDGSDATEFHVQYTVNAGDVQAVEDGFESGSVGEGYVMGGDMPWFAATTASHAGSYAAQAGDISHNQRTSMQRAAAGGPLSFWYRVSSEAGYDFLDVYIDDELVVHQSGNTTWTYFSVELAPGTHEVKWEYVKDGSESNGSDTAWIDDIQLQEDATVWADIVPLTGVGAQSLHWFPDTPGDQGKVRVRGHYGNGAFGTWDESDGVFTVLPEPADCNGNGIPDVEELDSDNDGLIDDCDGCPLDPNKTEPGGCGCDIPEGACTVLAPNAAPMGCRYLQLSGDFHDFPVAFRVTATAFPCLMKYVDFDPDAELAEQGYVVLVDEPVFRMADEWGGTMIRGMEIQPAVDYEIAAENEYGYVSSTVTASTWLWGDVDNNGVANFADILLIVRGFQQDYSLAEQEATDIAPCHPNAVVNFDDVFLGVMAFQGATQEALGCDGVCP